MYENQVQPHLFKYVLQEKIYVYIGKLPHNMAFCLLKVSMALNFGTMISKGPIYLIKKYSIL